MNRESDFFRLVSTESDSYILWNKEYTSRFIWTVEELISLLHEVFGDRDISDIMLAHDDYVRLMVGKHGYFLAVGRRNEDDRKPIAPKLPPDVYDYFLIATESRAHELTRIGKTDSSSISLKADKSKYNDDLQQIFFRLQAVGNSFARVGLTTVVVLRPLRTVPEFVNLNTHPLTEKLFDIKEKMVVFSGPTASGKSTSICSGMLMMCKLENRIVYSVENPIEYDLQHVKGIAATIKQFDINRDFNGKLSLAIESFLRMHGRILYASEVRSMEEVRAIIQAQRSDMQVFTTTHAPRAWDVVNRLLGEFPPEIRLSELNDLLYYLGGISSQKLVEINDKTLLIQDVVIFNDADRLELIRHIQNQSLGDNEVSSITMRIREMILSKVEKGEAVTQLGHLNYHVEKGFLTEDESRQIAAEFNIND